MGRLQKSKGKGSRQATARRQANGTRHGRCPATCVLFRVRTGCVHRAADRCRHWQDQRRGNHSSESGKSPSRVKRKTKKLPPPYGLPRAELVNRIGCGPWGKTEESVTDDRSRCDSRTARRLRVGADSAHFPGRPRPRPGPRDVADLRRRDSRLRAGVPAALRAGNHRAAGPGAAGVGGMLDAFDGHPRLELRRLRDRGRTAQLVQQPPLPDLRPGAAADLGRNYPGAALAGRVLTT